MKLKTNTSRLIAALAAPALCAATTAAVAVTAASATSATQTTPAATDNGLWHMMWGLLVVLAVMAAAFWVLKQFTRGGLAGSGPMRTVGTIALGPKERVVLIECNGTWVMVGTAPGRVNSLHTMPAPTGNQPTTGNGPTGSGSAGATPNVPPFMRWLDKALQGKAK